MNERLSKMQVILRDRIGVLVEHMLRALQEVVSQCDPSLDLVVLQEVVSRYDPSTGFGGYIYIHIY